MTASRWLAIGLMVLVSCRGSEGTLGTPDGSSRDSGADSSARARPVIVAFSATPAMLPAGGGKVTLAWTITGATTVVIDQGVGTVVGSSVNVMVGATTIFTHDRA